MASMTIRELVPERDATNVVALIREVSPSAVLNAAHWLHQATTLPPRTRYRAWVAEVDGRFAGRAEGFMHPMIDGSTQGFVQLAVTAAFRRRGAGGALYDIAYEYVRSLGAASFVSNFEESVEGVRFAEARGFAEARAEQIVVLDPCDVRKSPAGDVDLRVARDIDPHDLHHVDETATRDMPQIEAIESIPYEEWVTFVLDDPLFTLDGSFVAYVDGNPAACSMLIVDHESHRAISMFTGTVPEYRGRGLGLAAKLASIQWAAANGITQMATSNDETNAPMLAINRRLGYRPAGRRVEFSRSAD
jgi:GNAT superfamily N-acetyltransferase